VQKYPEVKLVVLGDGFLRLKIENLINLLNLSNKVFLLGNKKNIFPFLFQSNFFVLSSISEGSPNTLIEALAVGLPVVSTDCETGPREILAPDLGSLDKIEYPYIGKYGILSAPLEEDEIWDDRPLSFFEEKLFQAMEKIIQLDVKKSEPVVIDKFKLENVIDKWEKNII
jgi:glycosyltransferase involved in cell wall biosynthesis